MLRSEQEYNNLSDKELRKLLLEFQVQCGPITATTRQVYLRKLIQLESGGKIKFSSPKSTKKLTQKKSPMAMATAMKMFDNNDNSISQSTPKLQRSVSRISRGNKNINDESVINFEGFDYDQDVHITTNSPGHTPFRKRNIEKQTKSNQLSYKMSIPLNIDDETLKDTNKNLSISKSKRFCSNILFKNSEENSDESIECKTITSSRSENDEYSYKNLQKLPRNIKKLKDKSNNSSLRSSRLSLRSSSLSRTMSRSNSLLNTNENIDFESEIQNSSYIFLGAFKQVMVYTILFILMFIIFTFFTSNLK